MGLFNKLFAKANSSNEAQTEKVEPSLGGTDFTPISFQDLFEQYAGIAYEKQLALVDIIGDKDFNVDIRQGTISFSDDLVCIMDIYGTIAHASQTWLWAWANTQITGAPSAVWLLRKISLPASAWICSAAFR